MAGLQVGGPMFPVSALDTPLKNPVTGLSSRVITTVMNVWRWLAVATSERNCFSRANAILTTNNNIKEDRCGTAKAKTQSYYEHYILNCAFSSFLKLSYYNKLFSNKHTIVGGGAVLDGSVNPTRDNSLTKKESKNRRVNGSVIPAKNHADRIKKLAKQASKVVATNATSNAIKIADDIKTQKRAKRKVNVVHPIPQATSVNECGPIAECERVRLMDSSSAPTSDQYVAGLSSKFISSKDPNVRMLFDDYSLEGRVRYDVGCAPFCGVGALIMAVRKKVSFNDVKHLASGFENDGDLINEIGTPEFLRSFALSLGVNLAIYSPLNGERVLTHVYHNSPGFRWAVLEFLVGGIMAGFNDNEVAPLDGSIGHYVLLVRPMSDDSFGAVCDFPPISSPLKLADEGFKVRCGLMGAAAISFLPSVVEVNSGWANALVGICLIYSSGLALKNWVVPDLSKLTVFKKSSRMFLPNNSDKRTEFERRDEALFCDSFVSIEVSESYVIEGGPFNGFPVVGSLVRFLTDCEAKDKVTYLLSETRFNSALLEAQKLAAVGKDPFLAVPTITRSSNLNHDMSTLVDCNMSTVRFFKKYLMQLLGPQNDHVDRDFSGLIAFNAPNNLAVIANIDIVELRAGRSLSRINQGLMPVENTVLSFKGGDIKVNRPVAVAPTVVLETREGLVSPGLISLTDSAGVFAAFVGRSCNNEPVELPDTIIKFIESSKEWLSLFLAQIPVRDLEEPDELVVYPLHYRGKKTASVIAANLSDHIRFLNNELSPRELEKHTENGCFVKFESNVKISDGLAYSKPRMICTLSLANTFEGINVLEVIDYWNHTSFGDYQVKGLDDAEMVRRILEVTDVSHTVTDYSSFESSITELVRTLEMWVLTHIASKWGYSRLVKHLTKMSAGRVLTTKWGSFYIVTRCSGDFWTSFGNGVVNACVARYCALKQNKAFSFKFLVEGDDGVVPLHILQAPLVRELGFKYSCEMVGHSQGDCDFLRRRWVDGKVYPNVGRAMASIFWVKKGCHLRKSKQLFIQRSMAASLYHMSPGHPILMAVVELVGRLTSGAQDFKNSKKYLNCWKGVVPLTSKYPRDVSVDETMRVVLAQGGHGFPPISIADQLVLEERLSKVGVGDTVYIGSMLSDYDDIYNNVVSRPDSSKRARKSDSFEELVNLFGLKFVSTKEDETFGWT